MDELVIKRGTRSLVIDSIELNKYSCITIALAMTLLMTTALATIPALAPREVFSDLLAGGALTQRISNLEVELKTVPANPLEGEKTTIFLRIGSITGDDVADTPINIKITKQGEEIVRTRTITVPNGHYSYSYEFATPDTYGIVIEIQNHAPLVETKSSVLSSDIGSQNLLFTFPISVHSKSHFGLSSFQISLIIGVSISVFAIIFFSWRRTRNISRSSYQRTGKS